MPGARTCTVRFMKSFRCACGSPLFFENHTCLSCDRPVGLVPETRQLSGFDVGDDGLWRLPGDPSKAAYRPCHYYHHHQVCNWMVRADEVHAECVSCRLTRVIPNLDQPANLLRWYRIEAAKRRLLFTLDGLNLPIIGRDADPEHGLAFELLEGPSSADEFDDSTPGGEPVYTGHVGGVITINIAEADDSTRERVREKMGEAYRTLLGHFRHEAGHYYWDRLIDGGPWLDEFRALFGDEREDYGEALERHHATGAPADWPQSWISAYASMHPWEDWAETWAHYLHIVDTLETAAHMGVQRQSRPVSLERNPQRDIPPFASMVEEWNWLSRSLNALNRSLGLPDAYPFIPSHKVLEKLQFIDRLIKAGV